MAFKTLICEKKFRQCRGLQMAFKTLICEKKIRAEALLIYAEQMSYIILSF